jgi:hypothetical protein
MCDSRYSSANISNKPPRTAFCSSGAIVPSFLINLVLETDRMRSKAINPSRPSKQTGILLGYCFPLVVIGATMTVARFRFISLGETTRQGLVCLVSLLGAFPWSGDPTGTHPLFASGNKGGREPLLNLTPQCRVELYQDDIESFRYHSHSVSSHVLETASSSISSPSATI